MGTPRRLDTWKLEKRARTYRRKQLREGASRLRGRRVRPRLLRMRSCGRLYPRRVEYADGRVEYPLVPRYCELALCPRCAHGRMVEDARKVRALLAKRIEELGGNEHRFLFVTRTWRDRVYRREHADQVVDRGLKYWADYTRKAAKKQKEQGDPEPRRGTLRWAAWVFRQCVQGGLRSFEISWCPKGYKSKEVRVRDMVRLAPDRSGEATGTAGR